MAGKIKRFIVGPLATNSYVISLEDKTSIIIDPSLGCAELLKYIEDESLQVKDICLTHGHFDHIWGITEIVSHYPNIPVWIHPKDEYMVRNPEANGSQIIGASISYNGMLKHLHEGPITIGEFNLVVYHVWGHSPGSCVFVFGKFCFSGDTLFAGSIGRTDFPGGSAQQLVTNIRAKLFTLPDNTVVFPGHGGRSTIGREKRANPFCS